METIKKSELASQQSGSSPSGGSPETIEIRNDNSMIENHRIQSVSEKKLADEEYIIRQKILGFMPFLQSETKEKLQDRLNAISVEKTGLKKLKKVPVKNVLDNSGKTNDLLSSNSVSQPLMNTQIVLHGNGGKTVYKKHKFNIFPPMSQEEF